MSAFGGYQDLPFIAEYYDFIPSYSGRQDLDFYLDYARSAGGRILELGCGTGRVLIPTARAGYQIVGLDLSEYMLAKCRERLESQPREVQERARVVHGNMVSFALGETFALATIPFWAFQHLTSVHDQLSCLCCVNGHLAGGGKLILDLQVDPRRIHDPVSMEETEDVPETQLPDGRKLRRAHRIVAFHRVEQYDDLEVTYYVTYPSGRTERLVQAFPLRYFFRYEVEHLLARTGFRVTELFGDYDRSRLADDSPEMVFVAEKCEDIAK